MILHFHPYDVKVTYKPDKNLLIADTFSTAYLKEHENKLYDVLLDVNVIISLPMTTGKPKQFPTTTLSTLLNIVLNGEPDTTNDCDSLTLICR